MRRVERRGCALGDIGDLRAAQLAALSFLGLGVQPPDADWGSMVRDYRDMINFGSAAPLYPAAAIAILTIGVNFVVDWMLSIHSRGQGEGA